MNGTYSTNTHNERGRASLGSWTDRIRQRRALATLDYRMLTDIGISSADRDRECRKRFWQR